MQQKYQKFDNEQNTPIYDNQQVQNRSHNTSHVQEIDQNISRKGSQFPDDLNHSKDHHDVVIKRKPSYFDNYDRFLTNEEPLKLKDLPLKSLLMLKTSVASISTYMGIGILNVSQMIIVKQAGITTDIAAFGLGLTWINACSYAVIMALNDGIRNFSSHISGSKDHKTLGIIYNQSIAISWFVFLISLALILNSFQLLTFFGIAPDIAAKSYEFTLYGIPSLIGSIYFESSRQFLFSQKIFHVHMKAQLFAALLHPIWCYFFILHQDMGLKGAGIARSVTFLLSYVFVWIIMKIGGYGKQAIQPFKFKEAFSLSQWWHIVQVAVPAGGTNYLKWVSIECLTVLVGNLPNKNCLAGHAAFFSINIFFSMFAKGIQTTVNSFIGNAIGEAKEQLAKNLTTIAISATFLLCLILMLFGLATQSFFVQLLTTTSAMETQFLIAFHMYLCVDVWGNFLQQVQAGILSGMNRQNDTVKYYMWTFLLLQFVVAYFCGFYLQWGLAGVWLGRVAAGIVNSICFQILLQHVDIKQEIINVQLRIKQTKQLNELNVSNVIEGNESQQEENNTSSQQIQLQQLNNNEGSEQKTAKHAQIAKK